MCTCGRHDYIPAEKVKAKKPASEKQSQLNGAGFLFVSPLGKSENSFYSLSLLLIIRFSTSFATGPADAYPVPPFLIHTTKASG